MILEGFPNNYLCGQLFCPIFIFAQHIKMAETANQVPWDTTTLLFVGLRVKILLPKN